VRSIQEHDINFGIGPAGTGKTYYAVACRGRRRWSASRFRGFLLLRPAVEAGEKLGFLPGTIAGRIDPYLRPLYDALYEIAPGFAECRPKLIEKHGDRSRSLGYHAPAGHLNNALSILDERARTPRWSSDEKSWTRIGFDSTAVITVFDDLPGRTCRGGTKSGLGPLVEVLKERRKRHGFTHFNPKTSVYATPLGASVSLKLTNVLNCARRGQRQGEPA